MPNLPLSHPGTSCMYCWPQASPFPNNPSGRLVLAFASFCWYRSNKQGSRNCTLASPHLRFDKENMAQILTVFNWFFSRLGVGVEIRTSTTFFLLTGLQHGKKLLKTDQADLAFTWLQGLFRMQYR